MQAAAESASKVPEVELQQEPSHEAMELILHQSVAGMLSALRVSSPVAPHPETLAESTASDAELRQRIDVHAATESLALISSALEVFVTRLEELSESVDITEMTDSLRTEFQGQIQVCVSQ